MNRRCFTTWMVIGLLAGGLIFGGGGPGVGAQGQSTALIWLTLDPQTDLLTLKTRIQAAGGAITTLSPEGRLLVRIDPARQADLAAIEGVRGLEPYSAPPSKALAATAKATREPRQMGRIRPDAAQLEAIDRDFNHVTAVLPNELSLKRAALAGVKAMPSMVDNSLSQYFPPIDTQGTQGSCVAWASCYYYNTYTQAMDEGLTASGGDPTVINSPAFMYNLIDGGEDEGSSEYDAFNRLAITGCPNLALMPYNEFDYLTWPSEAAWVDALRRRTLKVNVVGTVDNGCTDAELATIKTHLANGRIAETGTAVTSNWYDNYPDDTAGVNNGVLFAAAGADVGGHAMAIVGYDDDKTYFDGVTTRQGAFLLANSWGPDWGVSNTSGVGKGFMWVSYDFFKEYNGYFGYIFYCDDRPDYRPKLYAVAGLNHAERGRVTFTGGIGPPAAPDWTSDAVIDADGGVNTALGDDKRVAVDLTDGIPYLSSPSDLYLFVAEEIGSSTSSAGTVTSADFYADLDGDGTYNAYPSGDPALRVEPGRSGYATYRAAFGGLLISPSGPLSASGPAGGPFTPGTKDFTLRNTGSTPVDWSVADNRAWIGLSKTSGTLAPGQSDEVQVAVTSTVTAPGTQTGTVTFQNLTRGLPHPLDVDLTVRPMTGFVWETIPAVQYADRPFRVDLRAVDAEGETVTTFGGSVNITAQSGVTIGEGTSSFFCPLGALYHDERTQALYLRNEIGFSGPITALALEIAGVPGQTLNNFTIRMRHTPMSAYFFPGWEDTGWTTVYQANATLTSTGWVTFEFSRSFNYNGIDSLMIDFSFNNSSYTSDGLCRYSQPGGLRTIYYRTDSHDGDPLTWAGPTPYAQITDYVPNVKLRRGRPIAIDPTQSGAFTAGLWSGDVRVLEQSAGMLLHAEGGGAFSGSSNYFQVDAPSAAKYWALYE